MYLDFDLQPVGHGGTRLVFSWDPTTGDVRGRHAEEVRKLAAAAQAEGMVTGLPYPTPHEITDPLRSLAEMAVVLGNRWQLPTVLAEAYPVIDDAAPGRAMF